MWGSIALRARRPQVTAGIGGLFDGTICGVLRRALTGDGWVRLVRVLAPLAAFWLEGWAALVVAVAVQEGGLWLASKLPDADARQTVRWLFVAAWGLRVAVALPLHYVYELNDGNGALFQDDYTNDLVAEWLVRIQRGDGLSIFAGHQHLLDSSYTYLLMGLYAVFGHAPLLPKLVNCGIAALSAVFIFDIARRAFRPSVAVLAGLGAAVMPTLVLWSIVTLKESLVLLLALVALWTLQRLAERPDARRAADLLVILLVAMVVSLDLRAMTTLLLVPLVPVVLLRRAQLRAPAWQLGLAGLALLIVLGGCMFVARGASSGRPPGGVIEDALLQIRHRRAQEAASARSQIRPQSEVISAEGRPEVPQAEALSDATPFSFVGDVIDPLGFALLAPAPWQARGLAELAVSGEMLVWYGLIGASFFAWRIPPRERLFVACLVAFGVGNWLVLAASEGNLGNLVRHRLMLAPTLLVLGAAGLDWLWVRAGKQRPVRRHVVDLRLEARVES